MSIKKTVAIAAAAGALAAISVPAMAFENEFHGTYSFNTTFSNFQNGTSGDVAVAGKPEKQRMNNFFEQRARLQYIAKASDDLKLVTHFEFDNRFGAGRAAGNGDLDTDFTNFELKHMYLDFNLGKSFNTKVGMMPYKDTIKGLLIDADVPVILTTTKMGAYTLGVGFARFDDDTTPSVANTGTDAGRLGDANIDMFILDNTFAFSKDTKAALSYYFIADGAAGETGYANASTPNGSNILGLNTADQDILLHTFALSGETKVGPVGLSGFAAMQAGHRKHTGPSNSSTQLHGWAANVAAKAAVGPGTAKAGLLFTSGNNSTDSAHYKGWVTSSVNTYNEGGMQILARNTAQSPTSTDRYIRRNVTNLALLTMGYDANLTEKTFLNANVGFGWTPASGEVAKNASDFMGTEINLEGGYKVNPNLTLKATGAYMILGGLYDKADVTGTKDPENPYSLRLHAQFKF